MLERLRSTTAGGRLYAAGPFAAGTVTFGGFTIGFFLWCQLIAHPGGRIALNDVALLFCLVAGIAAALFSWLQFSIELAKRSPLRLLEIMRLDAYTWISFALLWISFSSSLPAEWAGRTAAVSVGFFVLAKLICAALCNAGVRDVALTFLVTRLPLLVIAELAAAMIGQRAGTHVALSENPLLAVWGRWDATHYVDIATRGYFGTDMAFFPLYPTLISLISKVTGNHVVAGLLISNSAFFCGLIFLYRLIEREHDTHVAHRAIFYISIFPTAIFFSAIYTESLFFALTVAAFYAIREQRWITAGVIGFFASLTRVEGVLLVAPLLIEAAMVNRDARQWLRSAAAAVLTIAGLSLYMAYLWVLQGDPLYFSHVQAHWDRHLAPPWASIIHAFRAIAHAHTATVIANQGLELTFTIFMLAMLLAGLRFMRPSFAAYTALSILVPMSTSSLMSMPRFALVLFPLFIVLAMWGKRTTVHNAIVSFSLPLLGLFTVLFADWYWVA